MRILLVSALMVAALSACSGQSDQQAPAQAQPSPANTTSPTPPPSSSSTPSPTDPDITSSRDLYWDIRKQQGQSAKVAKPARATAACKEKEEQSWPDSRRRVLVSWADSPAYEMSRWVYFDEQGKRSLILSAYSKDGYRLEVRQYFRPDGSEAFFGRRWATAPEGQALPDWDITQKDIQSEWVPGC